MNYFVIPGLKSAFRHEIGPKMDKDVIIHTICKHFDVTVAQLKSVRKDRKIVFPRQVTMYYLYLHTTMNTVSIGKYFNRDHTTVIHSIRKVRGWMQVDSKIFEQVLELRTLIIDNHS